MSSSWSASTSLQIAPLIEPDGANNWQTRIFIGRSAGEARKSASEWLQNFANHGPLEIKSIKTEDRRNDVVAVVTIRDMPWIEPADGR